MVNRSFQLAALSLLKEKVEPKEKCFAYWLCGERKFSARDPIFTKRKGGAQRKVFAYGAKTILGAMKAKPVLSRKDDGWENGAKRHSRGQ